VRPSPCFVYALSLTLLFAAYPVAAQTPTIANTTPQSASAGEKVTITGTNFSAASTVKFGPASVPISSRSLPQAHPSMWSSPMSHTGVRT